VATFYYIYSQSVGTFCYSYSQSVATFCYSYNQSLATFSPLIAPSIHWTISILYSTAIIQSVPPFLRTVSDQTANVTLNSTAPYNHYRLITVHSSVYMLMFCSFHSKLHTNQKWRCHLLSMLRHGRHTFIKVHTFLHAALDIVKWGVWRTGRFPPGARDTLDVG